ncbi:SdrD B-like domain-containing protein [Actinoplanes sp. NPDC049668]|uniref:SdrD B-like domain-containing protein n=1 Tax=unclassified Actinoplanes TaxID=2626549 RepID=UPI0033BBEE2D
MIRAFVADGVRRCLVPAVAVAAAAALGVCAPADPARAERPALGRAGATLAVDLVHQGAASVPAGTTTTYLVRYSCSSATVDCAGPALTVTIPTTLNAPTGISAGAFVGTGGYSAATRTITWPFTGPITAGASGEVQFNAQIPNLYTGADEVITPTAKLSADNAATVTDTDPITAIAAIKTILSVTPSVSSAVTYLDAATLITLSPCIDTDPILSGTVALQPGTLTLTLPKGATVWNADGATVSGTAASGFTLTWAGVEGTTTCRTSAYKKTPQIAFPTGAFAVGQTWSAPARFEAVAFGGTDTTVLTATAAGKLSASPLGTFSKTHSGRARLDAASGDTTSEYGFQSSAQNKSTGAATNVVLDDPMPEDFDLTRVTGGPAPTKVEYQTRTDPSWRAAPLPPFPATSLNLGAGDKVTRVRLTWASVAGGTTVFMTAYGTTTGLPVGGKITDCTDGSMVLSGLTIVGRPCFTEGILSAVPNLVLGLKVVGSPPPLQPGDRLDLDLTNTNRASPDSTMAVLPANAIVLPPGVTYVDGSMRNECTKSRTLNVPTVTVTDDWNGTGRQRVTFTYAQGETLGIGVSECKRLTVTVQPGTAFGPKSIDTYLWDQNRPWGAEFNAPDVDDINDNKNTGENVVKVSTPITIASLGAVAAVKGVRGSLDTTYMRYPQVGHSRPDQATSYSLDLVNTGTVALTDGVAYDVLPRPDDGRGSTFRLDLTALPTVQDGLTVAYSTSANPCRPELGISAGCVDDWDATANDLGAVTALRFTTDPGVGIAPGARLGATWPMHVPSGLAATDTAYNSVSASISRADGIGGPFTVSPVKVGTVVVESGLSVSVPAVGGQHHPGELLTVPVIVTNAGPTTSPGTTLTLTVPPELTEPVASGAGWICQPPAGDQIVCAYSGDHPVGTTTVNLTGVPSKAANLLIGAELTQAGYDPDLADNSSSTTVIIFQNVRISGHVFHDADNDGVRDAGESPAGGVTVELLSSTGAVLESVGTDPVGYYGFAVGAGIYSLRVPGPGPAVSTPGGAQPPEFTLIMGGKKVQDFGLAPPTDLRVTASGSSGRVGDPVSGLFTLTNTAVIPAAGVAVEFTVPASVSPVNVLATPGWTITRGPGATFTAVATSDLAAGGAVTFTAVGVATVEGDHTFSAVATTDTYEIDTADNRASATSTVTPAADVEITLSTDDVIAVTGDVGTVTATVINNGPSTAAAPTMTVTLPAGLRVAPGAAIVAPAGWTVAVGPADGDVQTVTLTSDHGLRRAESESIDIPAKAMVTGPWYVRAVVASATYDRIPANNEYQLRLPVAARADLAVTVDTANAPRLRGGSGSLSVGLTNLGVDPAEGAVVTVFLPAGLALAEPPQPPPGWTAAVNAQLVTFTSTGEVSVGPAVVFTLAVRGVAPTAPQAVVSAGVTATTADPVNANNTATGPVTVRPGSDVVVNPVVVDPEFGNPGEPDPALPRPTADMAVTLTKPKPVRTGGSGEYTVVVANNGPSAAATPRATATLPAKIHWSAPRVAPPGWTVTVAGSTVTFAAASPMVVGRTVSFGIPFDHALAGAYAITATVGSATDDPVGVNNAARTSLSVGPIADVSVLVDTHSAPVVPGTEGSLAVTIADAGPDDAEAPVFTITLPAGLHRNGQVTPPAGWIITDSGQRITIRSSRMATGSAVTVGIAVEAASAGVHAVTATARSTTLDTRPADNLDRELVTVAAAPVAGNGGGASSLPVTGVAVTGIGWLAVGLLTVGFALRAAAGRPRRRQG